MIRRTEGAQPWRRVFHAANGLLVFAVLTFLRPPYGLAVGLVGAVAALGFLMDWARHTFPGANFAFFRLFRVLASPREARGVSSATWYATGVLIALAFFPPPAAATGILVLALADPVASYAGRRWGRRPLLGGSILGVVLFALVAGTIIGLRHSPGAGVAGGALLALIERRSWPLDDNLTVPVAGAAWVTLWNAML